VSRLFDFLNRLTGVSALPAHVMTYAVVLIWLLGACGFKPAADWWNGNAGSTTAFVQLSIGIWLAYRVGGKVTLAMATKKGGVSGEASG
jgi:hypothetical protein